MKIRKIYYYRKSYIACRIGKNHNYYDIIDFIYGGRGIYYGLYMTFDDVTWKLKEDIRTL